MRDVAGVVPPATFDEAVKRAYKFEDINNQIIWDRKQQNQRQQQNKRPRQDHNPPRQGACVHCVKNHESVQCRRVKGTCFRCGAMDHAIMDCSHMQNQGNRNQPQRQAAPQNNHLLDNLNNNSCKADNKSRTRMLALHSKIEKYKGDKIRHKTSHGSKDGHIISTVWM